jgi:hypothetical protein
MTYTGDVYKWSVFNSGAVEALAVEQWNSGTANTHRWTRSR